MYFVFIMHEEDDLIYCSQSTRTFLTNLKMRPVLVDNIIFSGECR